MRLNNTSSLKPSQILDFYSRLGILRSASLEEIKDSYRRLASHWHPDKNLENREEAHEEFVAIRRAFEVLSDPYARRQYDDKAFSSFRNTSSYPSKPNDFYYDFDKNPYKKYEGAPIDYYKELDNFSSPFDKMLTKFCSWTLRKIYFGEEL